MARDPVTAAERGETTVADRVVAKIAAQAAREALERLPKEGHKPHATVVVHREAAHVSVTVELDYPSDIGGQCGAVRRRVTERVTTLAGMDVPEVTVHVERLHSPHAGHEARGRLR
ncbi:hypothetical protein ABZO31_06875 [Streptomyces sp. HUAS MG47]|uniref:Asp23/Gls24 family envelope stress response protein n=1 Tax=Streptomyces solicamelliae TaxID=3231716 RepID=UPI003877D64E